MTVAVRTDLAASEVRELAKAAVTPEQARRLLAIALVLEGSSREDAARSAGMDRQTLRDWVHRFNAAGAEGLVDLKAPGRQRRLSLEQQQELAHSLESGPQLTRDGVVRWRLADLCVLVERRFGIRYQERGMGKLVRALGFSRVSARPQHPKSDPEVQAQFKKNLPTGLPLPSATRVRANGSRSGFRCYEGGLPGDWWVSNLSHRSQAWPPRPPNMVASSILPSSSAARSGWSPRICPGQRSRSCTGSGPAIRRHCSPWSRRCGRTSKRGSVRRSRWPAASRQDGTASGCTGCSWPTASPATCWSRPASWSTAARGGPRPTGSTPKACCAC